MRVSYLLIFLCLVFGIQPVHAGDPKPRWMTSSLPKPKSPGYIFISSQGSGSSLEEARQMAMVNLTAKLEHERGIEITSTISIKKTAQRNTVPTKNQTFTLEASERGKMIEITCRVIDEYWERKNGKYFVTNLYTVNDQKQPGQGSNADDIRLTTSYGAGPVFCSLIPGVGQFVKGSTVKGSVFLGATAVGAGAVILCENQRSYYAKRMKERPQHFDFYRNKKSDWETGRNIALGATGAVYLWNLIDAAVAPGRRRVTVSRSGYSYSMTPEVFDNGAGIRLALNF